jgi:hypothetical protein
MQPSSVQMSCYLCLEDKLCVRPYLCDATVQCRNYLCSECAITVSEESKCAICRVKGGRLLGLPPPSEQSRVLNSLAIDAGEELITWNTINKRLYDRDLLINYLTTLSTIAMYKGARNPSKYIVSLLIGSLMETMTLMCKKHQTSSSDKVKSSAHIIYWGAWRILCKHGDYIDSERTECQHLAS